jgi:Ca2+-binding RTX toxin-like protein
MATYVTYALPMPVVLSPGGTISFSQLLAESFGGTPASWQNVLLGQVSLSFMQGENYDFWNPSARVLSEWTINGGGIDDDTLVPLSRANFGGTVYHAGNQIGGLSVIQVPLGGADDGFINYSVLAIPQNLMSPTAGDGAPTPQDIVDSANRFWNRFGFVDNDFDCHYIAGAVAAAAGAVFTTTGTDNVDNPALNIEYGFWRIAYRGSDLSSNWRTLLEPGDIVRLSPNGGIHTFTVLRGLEGGNLLVYDNGAGGTSIREVSFPNARIGSITVYRLTTDGLFLINGTGYGDRIDGSIFNDRLVGLAGNDTLDGRTGADVLQGGGGNDTYVIGGGDRAIEFAGQGVDLVRTLQSHTLAANIENLTLMGANAVSGTGNALANTITGNSAANALNGGGGNDHISGGNGADTITGGLRIDTLTGGGGADRFVLNSAALANRDVITDFTSRSDKIHLENSAFTALGAAGNLAGAAFYTGAAAHDASDRIIYNGTTGALYYDRDGSGGAAQVQIATLSGHPHIVASDFLIV